MIIELQARGHLAKVTCFTSLYIVKFIVNYMLSTHSTYDELSGLSLRGYYEFESSLL